MGIPPESAALAARVSRGWVWAVRVTALLPFLLALGLFLSLYRRDPDGFPVYLAIILAVVVSLPNLTILWRLRRARPQKEGLAVAVAWGGLITAAALLVLVLVLGEPPRTGWKQAASLGLFSLFVGNHVVMAAGGVKLYYQLEKEPRDKRTLVGGVVSAGICFVILLGVAVALPNFLGPSRRQVDEVTTIGTLRTLNTVLVTHASTYPDCGYPDSLADLKEAEPPGPQQSGLLDALMAQDAFTKTGYNFSYRLTAGTGDCQGEPGVRFELTARPEEYGKLGQRRSFFIDETAILRFTEEDRAATADDPPL